MIFIIIILTALVLFLSIKLIVIKKEMRRITGDMKENTDGRNINVDFIDKDLQNMIMEVNGLYENIMKIKAEGKENEEKIRESISMISHDMRTPLTSIIGYLQVAERSDDKEDINSNIDIALDRAKYLNKLVNDFFELSLIESGQVSVDIERVNLCEVICEEILAESPEIDRRGIEPSFEQAEQNIYVSADKKKLLRIVQNLISNAVKYSEKRLEFRIETGSSAGENRDAGNVELSIITDSGTKIDTERIFDRFVKGDSARASGGAGLGLYICRNFARMMGGNISAEQDDENFIIRLELPVSQ
jgi:signal transduction histidine kinase